MREVRPVRFHLVAAGVKVAPGQDVFGMEHAHKIVLHPMTKARVEAFLTRRAAAEVA